MNISQDVTLKDIESVFEGSIPDDHPVSYLQSRMNDNMVLVAQNDEGEAIGFLIYNIWWGNCPFIELIKIRENYQRMGVGLNILEKAKEILSTKGFDKLVSSAEVINLLGVGFHGKAGFKKLNSLDLPHGEEQFYIINLNKKND